MYIFAVGTSYKDEEKDTSKNTKLNEDVNSKKRACKYYNFY